MKPTWALSAAAGADHRLLDHRGGVFGDRQPGARRGDQAAGPGVAELQRRGGVGVHEGLLDRRLVRARARAITSAMRLEQDQQPLGEGQAVLRRDHPVGDVGQPRAVHRHHAPAGAAQAGVEAQDADRAIRGHGGGGEDAASIAKPKPSSPALCRGAMISAPLQITEIRCSWVAGTSPAMTAVVLAQRQKWKFRKPSLSASGLRPSATTIRAPVPNSSGPAQGVTNTAMNRIAIASPSARRSQGA